MKRYLPLGLLLLSILALTSCANNRSPMLKTDLTQEGWMREIHSNPNAWTRGADNWFLTGDPNSTELATRQAPYDLAISTMNVNVPNFSAVQVSGDFQVQIFGTYGNNSVYVYGPNESVRDVIVEVKGNTLCVNQAKKVRPSMRRVIVRIGVNQLSRLIHQGRGTVEGIQLHSSNMTVTSTGSGNMYLAGNINVSNVAKLGNGCVSIFGVNTPQLDIKTAGMGDLNVSGNVGVRTIVHHGRTDVNIIGANTDSLKIYADGRGKIGINGIVNLREVKARDFARVYVYRVSSPDAYVYAYDKSRIGLAGTARNVYIDAFKSSCVGTKNLCSDAAYVRAHEASHVNIAASGKVFAAATENASIYLFGSPQMMSQFVSGNGVVIPIWAAGASSCPVIQPVAMPVARSYPYKFDRPSYKGERDTEYTYSKWKRQQIRKHKRPTMQGEG